MNTMHGALASAWANRSRTRAAPTPTNISTNSEPLRLKNGTFGFAGDRARQQRLAGAGRPDQQHALRNAAADARVLLRGLEELDDLPQLVFRLVHARHVAEPHLHVVVGVDLRAAARERHHAPFGAAHPPEEEAPERDEEDERDDPAEQLGRPSGWPPRRCTSRRAVSSSSMSLGSSIRTAVNGSRPFAAVGLERAADPILGDGDLLHLALAHERLELAVGDRLAACIEKKNAWPSASSSRKPEDVPHGGAGRARRPRRSAPAARRLARLFPESRQPSVDDRISVPPSPGSCLSRTAAVRLRELQLAGRASMRIDVAFAELPLQHAHRERVEDPPLDRPLERPRAVRRVVALGDEQVLGAIRQLDADLAILQPLHQPAQLDVDDRPHLLAR